MFTGVLKMVQSSLAVVSLTRVSRIPTTAGSFGLAQMDLQVRGQRAAAAVTRGVTASAVRGDKRRSSAPSAALLVLRIKLSHVFEHPRTVTVWFVSPLKHKTMRELRRFLALSVSRKCFFASFLFRFTKHFKIDCPRREAAARAGGARAAASGRGQRLTTAKEQCTFCQGEKTSK